MLVQFPALALEQLAAVPKAEPGAPHPQLQVLPWLWSMTDDAQLMQVLCHPLTAADLLPGARPTVCLASRQASHGLRNTTASYTRLMLAWRQLLCARRRWASSAPCSTCWQPQGACQHAAAHRAHLRCTASPASATCRYNFHPLWPQLRQHRSPLSNQSQCTCLHAVPCTAMCDAAAV